MDENTILSDVLPYLRPYLNLFSPVHREKPRFMALCAAVLSQAAGLLRLFAELLPAAFDPEQAAGAQLDALGMLAGVPRPGASVPVSDADYRQYLRAWILLHHWDGANGTLPGLLETAFPGMDARLLDNGDGTVSASLSGSLPFSLQEVFPRPAGIRLLESRNPGG